MRYILAVCISVSLYAYGCETVTVCDESGGCKYVTICK